LNKNYKIKYLFFVSKNIFVILNRIKSVIKLHLFYSDKNKRYSLSLSVLVGNINMHYVSIHKRDIK